MELSRISLRSSGLRLLNCSGKRAGIERAHADVMLQITRDAFISTALSLEPGRFA